MEEKPFAPSQKKLKKRRSQGEVPYSKLLQSSLFFLGMLLLLRAIAPLLYKSFLAAFHFHFSLFSLLLPLLLLWGGSIVLALFSNIVQTGPLFTPSALRPRLRKRAPFSWNQIAILCLLAFLFFLFLPRNYLPNSIDPLTFLLLRGYRLALVSAFFLLLLGIIDFVYQKALFMNKMRMSHEEKKEETKENEVKKSK